MLTKVAFNQNTVKTVMLLMIIILILKELFSI